MEQLFKDKSFKILVCFFVLITISHILYATYTMRGLYLDGATFMIQLLNNLSNNEFIFPIDYTHTRGFMSSLQQLPVPVAYFLFHIEDKHSLLMIYSASLHLLPLFFLYGCYSLSKRVNNLFIFFLSLFSYCCIAITYSIFSVVETIPGSFVYFILWTYLAYVRNYTKKDIIFISFLLFLMFSTYEYILYLGILFFLFGLYYAKKESNLFSKIVKLYISISMFCASLYTANFMIFINGKDVEILKHFFEAIDFSSFIVNLCSSISVLCFLILIFIWKFNKKLSKNHLVLFSIVFALSLFRLLINKNSSISPVFEGHFRTIFSWFLPLVFVSLFIFDLKNIEINYIKLRNCICIVLLCGITQTVWQMVNSYYWNENVKYMKSELAANPHTLYLPMEHEPISTFWQENYRRYIWHFCYAPTSILLADEYKQEKILMHYTTLFEDGNHTYSERLFVSDDLKTMNVPLQLTPIDVKNKFWDLTDIATAMKDYQNSQKND